MDIPFLRNEILSIKGFLKDLYINNPRRNGTQINNAKERELDILIKILYLICNGNITIRKEDFKVIKISKRLNQLKLNFEKKKDFLRLLKSSHSNKVAVLKKFCALYSNLLYTFFNLT